MLKCVQNIIKLKLTIAVLPKHSTSATHILLDGILSYSPFTSPLSHPLLLQGDFSIFLLMK